jgi:hypothetical protein
VARLGRLERFSLWTGALCGIAALSFDLFDRVVSPSPPALDVAFALSGDRELRLGMPIGSQAQGFVPPIPVDLSISNRGGRTAKTVTLLIRSWPVELRLVGSPMARLESLWVDGVLRTQAKIDVGDVRPGETCSLTGFLTARLPPLTFRWPGAFPGVVLNMDMIPLGFPFRSELFAENGQRMDAELYVIVAGEGYYEERFRSFWAIHGDTNGVSLRRTHPPPRPTRALRGDVLSR